MDLADSIRAMSLRGWEGWGADAEAGSLVDEVVGWREGSR